MSVVVLLVVIFFIWVWEPWSELTNEVTVYPAMCVVPGPGAPGDCPRYHKLNRITFRINEARAEVTYWLPGIDFGPKKLVNCAIRGNRNWICDFPGGSDQMAIRDGLKKRSDQDKQTGSIYVRKYQWWYMHLAGFAGVDGVSFGTLMPDQYD